MVQFKYGQLFGNRILFLYLLVAISPKGVLAMQKTSKIVAIVLTLVLVLNYPATVFANESENEFIRFFTDNSRMTKDGIFTFNIQI